MAEKTGLEDIFRYDKIEKAIDGVINVLGDEKLTVVESFFVIRSVSAALKARYVGASELFEQAERELSEK